MPGKFHYYRPQRTAPDDLEAISVGREHIIEELLTGLDAWKPGASRQHYLFIGPRGIGKTHVLSLIAHRIRLRPGLREKWYPLVFPEESYTVTRLSDFLLEALHLYAVETGDEEAGSVYDRVRYDDDEARVTDLVLDAFRRFHREKKIGFLLLVENLNRLLDRQIKDRAHIHLLRKILIEEEWVIMVGTSPTYLEAVVKEDEPLFEFFRTSYLAELTLDQQFEMLKNLAALENNQNFNEYLKAYSSRLRALYHFTGGNPRLTMMLYDLVSYHAVQDVQAELEQLLNQITPFYQDRMKEIGELEGKLIVTMSLLPEGCTPSELAKEARMDAATVRTLLLRLEKGGYIKKEPRRKKKTVYIIPERLFRIWHQMSHSRKGRGLILYLLEFFSTWYQTREERDQVWDEILETIHHSPGEDNHVEGDLTDYMDYIIEVSEGSEKYEREFERIQKVILPNNGTNLKVELEKLDTIYKSDGDYFFEKGVFCTGVVRDYEAAQIAFKEASILTPDDITPLFNRGVALEALGRETEAEALYQEAVQLIREHPGNLDSVEKVEFLLNVMRESTSYNAVRIASYILGRIRDAEKIGDEIMSILDNSSEGWRREHCIFALGYMKAMEAMPLLVGYLYHGKSKLRGYAATALGMIGAVESVDALVEALRDELSGVRGRAATALGNIGSKKAVDGLVEALKDEADNVRGSAATALGNIGSENAVDGLIEALKDEANNVRGSAATALGKIGWEKAVGGLVEVLKDEANDVRGSSATALGKIGSENAVDGLIEALKDEANNVRGSAATALGGIGSENAVDGLIEALKDEANNVRGSAAAALGKIGSEKAVDGLVEALKDHANEVRGSAATAIGMLGSVESVDVLVEVLKDESSNVRGRAATALGKVGSKKVVDELIKVLKDEEPINRGSAATALGNIASAESIDALIEVLRDESSIVRGSAATALGNIGSIESVNVLIELLKDESNNVRGSAATALGKIGAIESVDALIKTLGGKAIEVRMSAVTALGKIGSVEAVDVLIKALKDYDVRIRRNAANALGLIASEASVPYLFVALNDEGHNVRATVIIALIRIAKKIPVAPLGELVENVLKSLKQLPKRKRSSSVRELMEILFRSGNPTAIRNNLQYARAEFKFGNLFYLPYETAIQYIESGYAPAIMERQHPEMRDAVQLLVNEFEKGKAQLQERQREATGAGKLHAPEPAPAQGNPAPSEDGPEKK